MKAIRRAIILCWAMLIVCFIIKLFGGNWFEVMCDNEHFIAICKFIDEHDVLRYTIAFPFYLVSTYLIMCACSLTPKTNKWQTLLMLVVISVIWGSEFINKYIKLLLEVVMYLTMPIVMPLLEKEKLSFKMIIKKKWHCGIIGYALCFVFQIIALTTKNIGIKIVDDNTLVSLISIIDFYIMVVLYYLYSLLKLKKGVEKNGNLGRNLF